MSDPDRLAEIREHRDDLYGKNVVGPTDLISIRVEVLDVLLGEVDRLRGLLGRLEWAGRDGLWPSCPACNGREQLGHMRGGCWLAAELAKQ